MNKLVKTFLVLLSTFGLTNMSSAQDISLSLGVAGNYGFYAAQGKETNGTDVTTEYGGMETSHVAIFGEVSMGQLAVGIEYNPSDLDSPEKISIFESCNGDCSSSSSVTNKAMVSFQDMTTIYANLSLPAVGPIEGLYLKAGYISADVETKESLGTGGSYNSTYEFRGNNFGLILKILIILSLIYFILIGLNLCNGINFPSGFHHSSAIFENFSISFLLIVLIF